MRDAQHHIMAASLQSLQARGRQLRGEGAVGSGLTCCHRPQGRWGC